MRALPWIIVVMLLAANHFSDRPSDDQYRMAYGNYILAAVVSDGPSEGRYLFCCRLAEATRAGVPDGVSFKVEFASQSETDEFIKSRGTYGQFVRIN